MTSFPLGSANPVYLDEVVSELGSHRKADLAVRDSERDIFELSHETRRSTEPAEVAPELFRTLVIGQPSRQFLEVRPE